MSELLDFIIAKEDAFKSKARLTSLYSDFSLLRTTNPDGYEANVRAWRSALENAGRAGLLGDGGNTMVLKTGELERVLEDSRSAMGRPLGLGEVFTESTSKGIWISLHDFLHSQRTIYSNHNWMSIPSAWEIAHWVLRSVGVVEQSKAKMPQGDFVMLHNVEEASNKFLSAISNLPQTPTSHIFSLETFTAEFSTILSLSKRPNLSPAPSPAQMEGASDQCISEPLRLTATDIRVLLTHLSRDLHAASISPSITTSANITIKLHPNSRTSQQITQQDHTIATLQTLQHRLTDQISNISTGIVDIDLSIRGVISSGSTSSLAKESPPRLKAQSLLRRKHGLQQTLQKRHQSLEQVQTSLNAIEEAVGNVEMVRAMEGSATVLKGLSRQVGGPEGVERVVDQVAEARAEVQDVSGLLTEDGAGAVDDQEVEEELGALEKEQEIKWKEREEQEQMKQLEKLPDVPASGLGTIPGQESNSQAQQPHILEKQPNGVGASERNKAKEVVEKRLSSLSLEEVVVPAPDPPGETA